MTTKTIATVKFKGTRQLYDYVLPEKLSFLKPDTIVIVPVGPHEELTLALFKYSTKRETYRDNYYVRKEVNRMATHKDIVNLLF